MGDYRREVKLKKVSRAYEGIIVGNKKANMRMSVYFCFSLINCYMGYAITILLPLTFPAHNSTIRGVCIDGLNQVCVTAGGDCCLRFWRFKSKQPISQLKLEAQINKIVLHRDR